MPELKAAVKVKATPIADIHNSTKADILSKLSILWEYAHSLSLKSINNDPATIDAQSTLLSHSTREVSSPRPSQDSISPCKADTDLPQARPADPVNKEQAIDILGCEN